MRKLLISATLILCLAAPAAAETPAGAAGTCPNFDSAVDAAVAELAYRVRDDLLACVVPRRGRKSGSTALCDAPPPCDNEFCRHYATCPDGVDGCSANLHLREVRRDGSSALALRFDVDLAGFASTPDGRCSLDAKVWDARAKALLQLKLDGPVIRLRIFDVHLEPLELVGEGCGPEALAVLEPAVRWKLTDELGAALRAATRGLAPTCDPEMP